MAQATLRRDKVGFPIQALAPDYTSGAVASVSIGASATSAALPSDCDVVRVAASNDCYIRFGLTGLAAVATDSVFPKGVELFSVPAGATHFSVIQLGAVTGTVSVTRML